MIYEGNLHCVEKAYSIASYLYISVYDSYKSELAGTKILISHSQSLIRMSNINHSVHLAPAALSL